MEATERAIERLTQAHTEMTEAGPTEWPPLLVWLERSVTEMVKRGGAGSNGAGIPIDFEALHLLDNIKKQTALIREAVFLPKKTGTLLEDIAGAWKIVKMSRDRNELEDSQWLMICEEFETWVQQIEAEQATRPRKMELTVACPRCEQRWVMEARDPKYPEQAERKAAVVIEFSEGRAPVAECRNAECLAMWAGWAQVATLGFTVGAKADLAVLEACGITITLDTPVEVVATHQ